MSYRPLAAAAAVMMCFVCTPSVTASAYDAPSDIMLSLGSVQLERSQLSGDTLVELPIYIENNPGFSSLNMIFEIDENLSFDKEYEADVAADELGGVGIYRCDESGKTISICFETDGKRKRFTDDGHIGDLRLRVPQDIPDGSYDISFRESSGSFRMLIYTYNDFDAEFGAECFSQMQGGSVSIEAPPAQEIRREQSGGSPAPVQSSEQTAAPTGTAESEQVSSSEAPSSDGSAVTTAAAVTTTSVSTTKTTSTAARSTTSTTAASTSAAETSSSARTSAPTGMTETRKRGGLPFPAIIAAVIGAAAAVGLASRKRR